jgi:hypothetical protein
VRRARLPARAGKRARHARRRAWPLAFILKLGLLVGLLLLAPLAWGNAGFARPLVGAVGTADLMVEHIFADSNGTVGQPIRRVVNVLNLGPDAADDLSTTVTFSRAPSFVSFDRDTGDAQMTCNWSGTTVTCHATHSAAPQAQGAASSIAFLIVMATPGTLTITATASSSQVDPNPADNTRSDVTTVTAPPAPVCSVPKLLGKTLLRARRALAAAHCRLGRVGYAFSSARKRGRVVAQRPRAGVRIKAGARVKVVVGRGPGG